MTVPDGDFAATATTLLLPLEKQLTAISIVEPFENTEVKVVAVDPARVTCVGAKDENVPGPCGPVEPVGPCGPVEPVGPVDPVGP